MDAPDPFDTYFLLMARAPSTGATAWLNRLSEAHGDAPLSAALAEEHKASSDPSTLLSRTEARLKRRSFERARAAEIARAAKERAEVASFEERMPLEVRQANMRRLRAELEKAGIL